MDPRAVEISDIVKIFPTEKELLETSLKRDDILYISKEPTTIYMRLKNGSFVRLYQNGKLIVGDPLQGQDSYFGRGEPFFPLYAYHCKLSDTSGQTIVNAIDILDIIKNESANTTGFFGGISSGDYILVGSLARYGGIYVQYSDLGDVDPDNLIAEYLPKDSDSWISVPFMVTNEEPPLQQYANQLASIYDEDVRFGFNPLRPGGVTEWELSTMIINGQKIISRWGRFRIVSDIVADPVVNFLKLQTARFAIEDDGLTQYFGDARYQKLIEAVKTPNADKNPSDYNIPISPEITEKAVANQFNQNVSDGFILRGYIPVGLDTSIPVIVEIDWFSLVNIAGNVNLHLEITSVVHDDDSFFYDGNDALKFSTEAVEAVQIGEQFKKRTTTFLVPAVHSLPGDLIYASLHRDALPGNTNDTLAGSIVITDYRVFGYFWKP